MSKFSSFFKKLQTLDEETGLSPLVYGLILVALFAYVLPWLYNPGQALTLGAYDLAEWLSLHPGVRTQTPPLLASGLLRAQLVFLTVLIVVWRPRRQWLFTLFFVSVFVIAQLPPPEFVSQREDMNYQQQLALSIVTVILSAALAAWDRRTLATLIIAGVGAVTSLGGLIQAREFMQVFKLPADVHVGGVLLVAVYLTLVLLIVLQLRRVQEESPTRAG